MKKVGKYKLKESLGKGAFSVVHHGTDTDTGGEYAVKMCEKSKLTATDMLGELENEIAVLKKIKSRYIANLLDVIQTTRYYYLVLDLCKCTLFECIIKKKEQKLTEIEARRYFQELLLAVYSCHQQGVMHRDIKPENILLTEDDHIKLSDFGFACPVSKSDDYKTQCGTRQYLAPEVFKLTGTTADFDGYAVDVWSCGVVLYVMVCGRLPFADHDPDILRDKIIEAKFAMPATVSIGCADVISRVLNPSPLERPTIFQIMELPWFKEGFDPNLLEEINNELRQARSISIEPIPRQLNRHIPATLSSFSSPQLVESSSYHHSSMSFPTSYSAHIPMHGH
eukprot:TRINITY_DN19933_c0_g2_i1.p2 TRINITY_DN19933_c0_g2~~TRINITY_DN19933_c0_g2_i1.p2  ORF type:complete len:338 (+),score=81.46 TRINITY_DN19933_c0_g2_i1:37-1050(+)